MSELAGAFLLVTRIDSGTLGALSRRRRRQFRESPS
jgi:hypothetical protein